jgi:PAS domain S-box-containing protein
MPLRDYRGTTDVTLDNVGKIVFWSDITHSYTSFISDFKSNLIYAAIAYIFVELLLFFGIGKTTVLLNLKIKQRTKDLQLYAKIFNDTNEGINITDDKRNIILVNPAFSEITGYSQEEIIGKNPRFLGSGRQSPQFYSTMWKILNEEGHWQGEVWNRKKDGSLYAELLSISALTENGKITNYVGIFSDITQIKKQQQILEKMAHYDVLTQLPNRVLLADRFNQALAHNKRQQTILAVCFIDLDDFKPVNDLYGHEVGDKITY